LAEALEEPFLLFFVGMGKFGKSTLINSLLGLRKAEMDALPKTWKIDVFYGANNKDEVEIKYNNGLSEYLSYEEAQAMLEEEEIKREKSDEEVRKELRKQMQTLDTIEEKEELKEALEKHLLYKSPVIEARWPVQKNKVLEDFQLVDTPGLVQDLLGEMKMEVNEYYHKADGVIWLLDATKIAGEKSKEMLDKLTLAIKEVGGRTDNIIGVLNSIDLVRNSGGRDAVEKIMEEAESIFGRFFENIIPISAKEALEAVESSDQDLIESSGLSSLHDEIYRNFYLNANKVQLESKKIGAKRVLMDLEKTTAKYREKLQEDNKRRLKLKIELSKDIKKTKKVFLNEIDAVLSDYRSNVEINIDNYAKEIFYQEQSRDKYIKNRIFEKKQLQQEIKRLEKEINETLNSLGSYHQKRAVFKEFEHLNRSDITESRLKTSLLMSTQGAHLDEDDVLSTGIGVAFAFSAIFGPIGFIVGGLASYFGLAKWILLKFKLGEIKQNLRSNLDDFIYNTKKKLRNKVMKEIKKIENKAASTRESSFAELHGPSSEYDKIIDFFESLNSAAEHDLKKRSLYETFFQDFNIQVDELVSRS
jgi:GTPase SAR1 family protein